MEEFSIIDLETTGFSTKYNNRVIEVAVIRINEEGDIIDSFETLINPERDVGPTHVHKITNEMIFNAPYFRDIASYLIDFINNSFVVCHNASFDVEFLKNEFLLSGFDVTDIPHICTLKLSKKYLGDLPSKKLTSLCEYFDIQQYDQHSAFFDSQATAELFYILLKNYVVSSYLNILNLIEPFVFDLNCKTSNLPYLLKRSEIKQKEAKSRPNKKKTAKNDIGKQYVNAHLTIKYVDREGKSSKRTVEVKSFNREIMKAYCKNKNAMRSFRFERIQWAINAETGKTVPDVYTFLQQKYDNQLHREDGPAWEKKTQHTIVIDGKEIKLSKESYNNLKRAIGE